MISWTLMDDEPEKAIRNAVALYDLVHGIKRGRDLLAQRANITPRRLKTLVSEHGRPYADEHIAILKATMQVRRERATRLRSELQQIEREEARHAGADVEALPSGLRMAG